MYERNCSGQSGQHSWSNRHFLSAIIVVVNPRDLQKGLMHNDAPETFPETYLLLPGCESAALETYPETYLQLPGCESGKFEAVLLLNLFAQDTRAASELLPSRSPRLEGVRLCRRPHGR